MGVSGWLLKTTQLLSQVMKLSYFPQIKLVHTSKVIHGQIYIPFANWLLMIGTVIVTVVYSNVSPERPRHVRRAMLIAL